MIRIKCYEKRVEEVYWECVNDEFSPTEQQKILNSCIKYMPSDFFSQNACFKELILAPYEKIKKAYEYIEKDKSFMENECFQVINKKRVRTKFYKKLYDTYGNVSQKFVNGVKMNIFLVEQTGFTVCPYCNRDYINSRSERLAGAQLDHFYPRSRYPIFAVCLYNLVPVCGNCNRIKHDNMQRLASPFDEKIDWKSALKFSYIPSPMNRKKIIINAKKTVKNNLKVMHIEEAYQIHEIEVNELLDKFSIYSKTQLKEFIAVFGEEKLTELEIKKMVFGPEITEESMKKKPLGRMLHDLQQELGIYK